MEKLSFDMLRSILFNSDKKTNILAPQPIGQDVIDFNDLVQDSRCSEIGIVAEPEAARSRPSAKDALIKEVKEVELSTREHYKEAFGAMSDLNKMDIDQSADPKTLSEQYMKIMKNISYMQYQINMGHMKIQVATKIAHMLADGVKTLYRQQG